MQFEYITAMEIQEVLGTKEGVEFTERCNSGRKGIKKGALTFATGHQTLQGFPEE